MHAAAGVAALVLGPLALTGGRRPRAAYRALVLGVAATALPLAATSSLPVAVRAALAAVALGTAAAAARASERALRGSYVGLVAALAFVSAPVWVGALVVVLGSAGVHLLPDPGTFGPGQSPPARAAWRARPAAAGRVSHREGAPP